MLDCFVKAIAPSTISTTRDRPKHNPQKSDRPSTQQQQPSIT
jgi:hypothetical protein